MQTHATTMQEIDSKQVELDAIQRQSHTLGQTLSPTEKDQLEQSIKTISQQYKKMKEASLEKKRLLNKGISDREAFGRDLENVESWLSDKEGNAHSISHVPLKTEDIAKKLEAQKGEMSDIRMFSPSVVRLLDDGQEILDQNPDDKQLADTLQDIRERYDTLKTQTQGNVDKLHSALSKHKQIETDMIKLEHWLKDATNTCNKDLHLDSSVDQLSDILKKHKNLSNASLTHKGALKELLERAESLKPELTDADYVQLKESLANIKENFDRTESDIGSRLATLDEAFNNKSRFESETNELSALVHSCQQQLQQLTRGIGPHVEDAERMLEKVQDLQDQLVDYQPKLTMLRQSCDQLRALGQSESSEELLRLTAEYEQLVEHVSLQKTKLTQALKLRETYHTSRTEVESNLKDLEEQIEAVDVQGVPMQDKLNKYKNVLEEVHECEMSLAQIEDQGKQIAIECPPAETQFIHHQLKSIKNNARKVRRDAEQKQKQLQLVVSERADFDRELTKCDDWLRAKEAGLKVNEHLSIDVEGVEKELGDLHALKKEIDGRVKDISRLTQSADARYAELDESMPQELQDKIDSIEALKHSIQDKLSEHERTLVAARELRMEHAALQEQVATWCRAAEAHIKHDYEGVKYDKAQQQLQQHQEIFKDKAQVQEQMDTLLDLGEKITPSLDLNDKATLKESLASLSGKVAHIQGTAEQREKQLQNSIKDWEAFEEMLAVAEEKVTSLSETLEAMPLDEDEFTTLEYTRERLHNTQDFAHQLQLSQPTMTSLSEHAQRLQAEADMKTGEKIRTDVAEIESRWSKLLQAVEDKQEQLQETVECWESYDEKMSSLRQSIDSTLTTLGDEGYDTLSTSQLMSSLSKTQEITSQAEKERSQLSAAQKTAQGVLSKLPGGQAKANIQKELLQAQDQVEQLQWKTHEQQKALENELAARQEFKEEVQALHTSLDAARQQLQALDEDDSLDLETKLARQQELREQIAEDVARLESLIGEQREKYGNEANELPPDLEEIVQSVKDLHHEIANQLEEKEKQLSLAKSEQQEFSQSMNDLTDWLTKSEVLIGQPTSELGQSQTTHQALIQELEENLPKLEKLKLKLEQQMANASPEQRKQIQAKIHDIEFRMQELKDHAERKGQELSEAAELWQMFEEESQALEDWTEHARDVTASHSNRDSVDSGKSQVESQRALCVSAEDHASRLDAMQTLLDKLQTRGIDTSSAQARLQALQLQQTATLEEANIRLEELEQSLAEHEQSQDEMAVISKWASNSQSSAAPEEGATLQQQLQQQEQLLTDADERLAKIRELKKKLLMDCPGADTSQFDEAEAALLQLKETAETQKQQLRHKLETQQRYENEAEELKRNISDAQRQMNEAPVSSGSAEHLAQQMARHNALAAQVKNWEQRIIELNAKSAALETGNPESAANSHVAELSDTESELGMQQLAQLEASGPNNVDELDAGETQEPSREISATNGVEVQGKPEADQCLSAIGQRGKASDEDTSDNEYYYATELDTIQESNESLSDEKSADSIKPPQKPLVKSMLSRSHDAVFSRRDDNASNEAQFSANDELVRPKKNPAKNELRSQSPFSVKSDDTDMLMDECELSLNDPERNIETSSVLSGTSTLDLIDNIDEAFSSGHELSGQASLYEGSDSTVTPPASPEPSPRMDTEDSPRSKEMTAQQENNSDANQNLTTADGLLNQMREQDQAFAETDHDLSLSTIDSADNEEVPNLNLGDVSLREHSFLSAVERDTPRTLDVATPRSGDQMSDREDRLRTTLEERQDLDDRLKDVNAKLEAVSKSVNKLKPEQTHTLETQLEQVNEALLELDTLEPRVREVCACAEALGEQSSEVEHRKAMQAAVRMLTDKADSLRAQAKDKQAQIQAAATEREKHKKALQDYRDKVKDMQTWLSEAQIDSRPGEPLITSDITYIKDQLRDNQRLEGELSRRLAELSDLGVSCERLCEQESPAHAHALREELRALRTDTEQLKQDSSAKQDQLQQALKDCKSRQEDLKSYQKSVENLTDWIKEQTSRRGHDVTDTRDLSTAQKQSQTELLGDLNQTRGLVRDLQDHVASSARGSARSNSSEEGATSAADDTKAHWHKLQRQMSEKHRQLQDIIEATKPSPFHGLPIHTFRPLGAGPDGGASEMLGPVRDSLAALKECWDSMQGQMKDIDARLSKTLEFQALYQTALHNISGWLDEVEQRLFATPWNADTEQRMRDNDTLLAEIAALQAEISTMNQACQQFMSETSADSRNLIRQAMEDLSERLRLLEGQARQREAGLQERNTRQRSLQDTADELSDRMTDLKESYERLARSEQMLDRKLSECERLAGEVSQCEMGVTSLVSVCDDVTHREHVLLSPSQLSGLQSQLMTLRHIASETKAHLERALSLQSQYERMLEEYTEFMETAQSKLLSDDVSAMTLDHLRQQVKTHREFFEDLESNRAMLDALAEQVDRSTRQHFLPTHTRVNNLTHVVQDKASIHGQKLERLEKDWREFDELFKEAKAYMRRVNQMAPRPMGELDTLEEMRHKIWDFSTLERSLQDERPTMQTALDKGRHLLQAVTCPSVEAELAELTDSWLKVNNDTTQQLSKLESMVDQMEQFERDATTLDAWLTAALSRVHILASLEEPELQSLGAIKQKMELFLDFRKEVEGEISLKTQAITLGNQLMRARPRDSSIQQRMDSIEDQWLQLISQLPNNEEQLHAAKMELLPSRQSLNELLMWLDGVERVLAEDEQEYPCNLMDVGIAMHKYKGLKVDLANKQMTVDFVNQTSLDPPQGAQPANIADFSEQLGEVNNRYKAVSNQVVEKMKFLQELQARWEDYDKMIKTLQIWFTDQGAKLNRFQRIGHEICVQHALKECKDIQERLRSKENEIDNVKSIGKSIIDKSHSAPQTSRSLLLTIDELNQQWANLDHQVYQLCNTLEDALTQWDSYHQALNKVNRVTTETDYTLQRYRHASSDLNTFRNTIQQLQTLKSEFVGSRAHLELLVSSAKQLTSTVDTIVRQSIDRGVRDATERYHQVSRDLEERMRVFETVQTRWQTYNTEFEVSKAWVEAKEAQVNALIRKPLDDPRHRLEQAKELEAALNRYRDNLHQLGYLSDQLTPHMDNATVIYITSKETSLCQRHHNLLQAISKYIHGTQADSTKQAKFGEAYSLVDAFLEDAERVLHAEDPNKSCDEDEIRARLSQLKDLSTQFSRKQVSLDLLNEIGFRLPLSETNSRRLRELNERWQSMAGNAQGRHKGVQGTLLLHEDFNGKCEDWSNYLNQVERDLATDIAGNYDTLLDQQQAYANFQAEMSARQQILSAIVDEGHQMIQYGDFDDNAGDFSAKLEQLEDRWHSVVRRANQRKSMVDGAVLQWQQYESYSERLHEKMDELKRQLGSLNFDSLSMQKARELHENIKRISRFVMYGGSMDPTLNDINKLVQSYYRKLTVENYNPYGNQTDSNPLKESVQQHVSMSPSCDACLVELNRILNNGSAFDLQSSRRDLTSQEPLYQKLMDTGKMLMANSDPAARQYIQSNLDEAENSWFELLKTLDARRKDLDELLGAWRGVEQGLDEGVQYLKEVRTQLNAQLPDSFEQLQLELHKCKEVEQSLDTARRGQEDLLSGQQGLGERVMQGERALLQQRTSLLNKQWAEMNNQVTLRRQQIHDKLQNWSQFNDKYRELIDKMTDMEERITNNSEFHIEDLIKRIDSEFKDELVSIAGEKEVLTSRGRNLMRMCSDVRASDIDYKLSKMDDKWTRLQDLTSNRSKKLRETLSAVQQLEQSMAKLRQWLAHIEQELGSPIVYQQFGFAEIQRCLQQTQELQREIERHTTGVSSVLNLCEVLLHDSDACPSTPEQRSITQARDSLNERWKNICAQATERRMTIEETWHEWQKWTDDLQRFQDWLTDCERKVKYPKMAGTFPVLRHEHNTFEAFKGHVHNSLSQLESLNRLYRKLAREGRTDQAGQIKKQTDEFNRRWDELLERTSAINRRLRHMLSVKDDFDATRKALIVWLSDISMRLSNLEFLSESSPTLRLQNIQAIKEELTQNQHRLDYIDKAGSYLIAKSAPEDSTQVQSDVEHFHQVLEQVLSRLNTLHQSLQQPAIQQTREELEYEGSDLDLKYQDALQQLTHSILTSSDESDDFEMPLGINLPVTNGISKTPRHNTPQPRSRTQRTTRATPKRHKYGSDYRLRIRYDVTGPDDWDLNGLDSQGDLSSGNESSDDEFAALGGSGPHTAAASARTWRMHLDHLSPPGQERLTRLEGYLAQLEPSMERARRELESGEKMVRSRTPLGPEAESARGGFDQLLHACASSIDDLQQLERDLQRETGVTSSDRHIASLVKRWERLQTSAIEKNYRLGNNKKMWAQFKVDLSSLQQWLTEAETLQSTQTQTPNDMGQIESAVCSHKEFLVQLDSKKPVVLSMNLVNKDLIARSASTPETRSMAEQLDALNARWDKCCARAALWQKELQIALLHSSEFNNSLRDLADWLAKTEAEVKAEEPVNFSASRVVLVQKYSKFREAMSDLQRAQPRVTSYQKTADQLLDSSDTSEDSAAMREKMAYISVKLAELLKICATYVSRLESGAGLSIADAKMSSSSGFAQRISDVDDADGLRRSSVTSHGTLGSFASPRTVTLPRSRLRQSPFKPRHSVDEFSSPVDPSREESPFSDTSDAERNEDASNLVAQETPVRYEEGLLTRILRTSLPIQGLMLLLLGIASLVPICEDEWDCILSNNLENSFQPMLRYVHGQPPT